MQRAHPQRKVHDVINLHLEFFRRTAAGKARFTVREIKIGSRVANLHLTLAQKEEGSDKYIDEVEAYATLSGFAKEEGLSFDTGYKLLPAPMEVDLQALSKNEDKNYARRGKDPYGDFRRAANNIQMHLVKPARRAKEFPKALIDQWVRFTPVNSPAREGRWTNDALGYVVDIFPQMVEQYMNPQLEAATIGGDVTREQAKKLQDSSTNRWYPTLALNLDVKKALPANGAEWLFVRIQSGKIQNGRFDLTIHVLDESGDLVATSSHCSLIMDASRNMNRKNKNGGSKI